MSPAGQASAPLRSRWRLIAGLLLILMTVGVTGWLIYPYAGQPARPSNGFSATVPAGLPGATVSVPAPPPASAASGVSALREAVSGAAQARAGTDCPQLNEAHTRVSEACRGQPQACVGDKLRAAGFDPAAHDLCRMFRPGKSPLN